MKAMQLMEVPLDSRIYVEDNQGEPAIHYDTGKLRYDLVPPDALEAYVDVLGNGAQKYEEHNWERGASWSRYFASAQRHLWKWYLGEDIDPKSGCHHLAHAMANVSFLLAYALRSELYAFDDRRKRVHSDAGRVTESVPSEYGETVTAKAVSDSEAATKTATGIEEWQGIGLPS